MSDLYTSDLMAEAERIAVLKALGILDTEAEAVFDQVTQLLSDALDLPITLVSLVDAERLWFKSKLGVSINEMPRERAFCSYAIQRRGPLVVNNALEDPRFSHNPLVIGEPYIRFYAGVPVNSIDGHPLGTLCAIDTYPRVLTDQQLETLEALAGVISREIQRRETAVQTWQQLQQSTVQLKASEARFRTIFERAGVGISLLTPTGQWLDINETFCAMLGFQRDEVLSMNFAELSHADDMAQDLELLNQLRNGEIDRYEIEKRYRHKNGEHRWVRLTCTRHVNEQGELDYYVRVGQDIQARKEAELSLAALHHDLEQRINVRTQDLQQANERLTETLEQKEQSEQALRKREAELSAVLENSSDAYVSMNEAGRIVDWNRKAEALFGWSREDAVGQPVDRLIMTSSIGDHYQAGLSRYLSGELDLGEGAALEIMVHHRNGARIPVELKVTAVDALDHKLYSAFLHDISERRAEQERREREALEDSLTGLPNRRALYKRLKSQLGAKPTLANPLLLLCMDLDNFKPVNDTLGHAAGDRVLMEIAHRLKSSLGRETFIARMGGDEFVILLRGVTGRSAIEQLCERILAAIIEPVQIGDQEVIIGSSIGIVCAPQDGQRTDELLRLGDIALYEAKAAGRNTWQFYSEEMNTRILARRRIESDLKLALQRDELRLEFQPRFDTAQKRMLGAEALVRWEHPIRGYLGPYHFITVAEETGLIVFLSDWVMRKACLEALEWAPDTFVSVNLSPLEFKRSDVVARVMAVLTETGLPPHQLELEITEGVVLDNANSAREVMHRLKALGVRLAMDDFGTGYSSLSYLHTYPFDGIKIDRSFIAGLDTSSNGEAVIEAIIGLGRALSLTVTAEGVETQRQMDVLARLKCNQAQGYYLARPMRIEALKALMDSLL